MKVERIICPVCKAEVKDTSDETNLREYWEHTVTRVCDDCRLAGSPEAKLLEAIFGEGAGNGE